MSPELGIQLADIGFKTIDGLGNMWADKYHREKKKELLQEINELREAYAERINGPGSGGGTASGHLGEVDYLNYFMPAIQSTAATGYYQLANYAGNKAYEAYLKNRHPAGEESLIKRPGPSGDATTESLKDTPIAAAGEGNPNVKNNLGMDNTGKPVGMAFPGNLIMGSEGIDAQSLANIALIAMMFAKKGTKLVPRQK